MNWPLPLLFAQTDPVTEETAIDPDRAEIIKRVEESTLSGTTVPDSSIEHVGADSFVQFYDSSYWFPEQASEFATGVDGLFMYIFWVSLFFFVAIVAAMVYFCVKYRRVGNEINPQPSPSHNTAIEILWSVGPSVFLAYMFFVGAAGYFDSKTPPPDAEEIYVTASRWNWVFTYPNGDSSAELHLIKGRPTKLVMQSSDVLHSMYVPAFRQKMDIVPGRYTYAYIVPTQTGEYRLSCTEYCGREHSKMRTVAIVHDSDKVRSEKTRWIEEEYYPWKNGERIYKINCSGCHKINGQPATGPALNEIWGDKNHRMHNGDIYEVNLEYVKRSIWEPNADIVEGFGPVSKMNSFKNKLKDPDILQVVAFLKWLKDPSLVKGGNVESGLRADGGGTGEDAKEMEPEPSKADSDTSDVDAEQDGDT